MENLKIHGQRLKNLKKNQRLPWKNANRYFLIFFYF